MEKKAKCVRSVLSTFFPTFPFSTAFLASSRRLQMCVFPTSIWRHLALEPGDLRASMLPAGAASSGGRGAAATLWPRLSCPTRRWMEGRGAGREHFCFLPDEYSLDVKLLNADKTLLPSKYVSHIKALRKVKKGIHTLFLPSSPRFNLKKYLFSLYSEQRKE